MNKKINLLLLIIIMIVSTGTANAEIIYSNLTISQKTDILNKKMKQAQTDKVQIPMTLLSAGSFNGHHMAASLILTSDISGDVWIENTLIDKDLIIAGKNINTITLKNSTIKGDIYVIDSNDNTKIDIKNGKLRNIYIASPVSVSEIGSKAEIYNIILTKHLKKGTTIKINAYMQKLLNHADGINVYFQGKMNVLAVNKPFNLSSNKNAYKMKTSGDYTLPDTVLYDLSEINMSKGYANINDGTSYQDIYNRLKKEQYSNIEKISLIVKNPTDINIKNTNEAISEQLNKFLPNNSSGFYITSFNDRSNNYGIYNIYFLYDTSIEKLSDANKVVDSMYSSVKNLSGIDYIRAINKMIAMNIVYDESLTKHSLYDAAIGKSSVCDGYAKIGYELLSKKFGNENNILIANKDHIWNMVKLNGKWYHIDFTHNDPVTKPLDKSKYLEDYILISDDKLKSLDTDRTWNTSVYPRANESIKIQ